MNDYVTLDSFRYAAPFGQFTPKRMIPHRLRYTLSGTVDATFGPASPLVWEGKLKVPVTPLDSDWGDLDDFRATVAKKAVLDFEDHYGDVYTVYVLGPFDEVSKLPVWDAVDNVFYISVRIIRATGP